MADRLRECPFCGGPGHVYKNGSGTWTAMCDDDNDCSFTPYTIEDTEAEAIAAWNRRPTAPTNPGTTHHAECWRDHHACAVRKIEGVGWIAVSERLPDRPCAVLIFHRIGEVAEAYYMSGQFSIPRNPYSIRFENVTHWQPLPQPPDGEKGK